MLDRPHGKVRAVFKRNKMKYLLCFIFPILILASCSNAGTLKLESPEKKVKIQFQLNSNGQPYYQVFYNKEMVLDTSLLGFDINKGQDLKEGFDITDSQTTSFDETWEQPWGEQHFIRNQYNELRITLQEKQDLKRKLIIVFRVYDDGIGFRYEFPEQENLHHFEILDELTEFNMAGDYGAWWIPAFQPIQFEYLYRNTPLSLMGKVHTPATFDTGKGTYLNIHEAELKDYSSMVIDACCGTKLKCLLYPYSVKEESKAFVSAPGKTPWRTIQLASSPGDLITSYLILNLNEPNQLGNVSWFKPGKYVGIWWEMHIGKSTWSSGKQHGATTANTEKYIDFAAKNGFHGVLVEGWNIGWDGDWTKNGNDFNYTQPYPDFNLPELSQYASAKGIYLVGHHETAGNIDNYERQMPDAFSLMEKYGYKAVKTGYVESGNILTNGKYHFGQAYIDHFRKVYQLAAQYHIAVVAHEPIKDTGERRTYPNMISREGARGQEFNAWSDDGGNPPSHEEILPFTRCLAGPMDFTPGVFDITIPSKPNNQVNTTLAKQLALYVTMYSPMQMACDLPEHYEKYPDAFEFIKEVGVDWETTKILEAKIGEYITTAREERNTGNWFIGSITNENSREVTIHFDFLEKGQGYNLKIYKDGADADYQSNPESYSIETRTINSSDSITVHLARGGGVAMSLLKVRS